MSVSNIPKFPTLYISDADRVNLTKSKTLSETTLVLNPSFLFFFGSIVHVIKKDNNEVFININSVKVSDSFVNQIFEVGTIPVGFRPTVNISGTFSYGVISLIGTWKINTSGVITIQTASMEVIYDTDPLTCTITYKI